jgi:hypothetical protein
MTARMPIDERTATTDSMDAISLYSLAWACHDYAVLWNHDSAYWYFRKHREGAFSLCEEEHRKGLTELLNRWRCRLPVTGLLSERLHAWGNKNAPVLGSFRTNLLHLDKSGFSHAGKLYDTLCHQSRSIPTLGRCYQGGPQRDGRWSRLCRLYAMCQVPTRAPR